jgi:hypothetical protein
LLIALTTAIALTACSKTEAPKAAAPAAPAAAAPGSAAMPVAALNTGKLLSVEKAGIYTYAEIEVTPERKIWIAGGDLDAQPGDTVQWGDAAVMRNFTAKSINRTFPEILFISAWSKVGGAPAMMAPHGVPGGGAAGMGAGHPPVAGHPPMGNQAPMGMPAAAGGGNSGMVKSVASAGGYSYLEVDQGGKIIWVAAPENPAIKAGNSVSWAPGPVMSNFTAKSLNRTFDSIVFAGGVSVQ